MKVIDRYSIGSIGTVTWHTIACIYKLKRFASYFSPISLRAYLLNRCPITAIDSIERAIASKNLKVERIFQFMTSKVSLDYLSGQ